MKEIAPGRYKHYKGGEYEVIGVGYHSETEERLVAYRQLYQSDFPKGTLWFRPEKMFLEEVEVEGEKVSRFQYIGDE